VVTYTTPGMKSDSADKVIALLQDRLDSLNDLALTGAVADSVDWHDGAKRSGAVPGDARGRHRGG
jgi:hypothetical protein